MTIQQCYLELGGNYAEAVQRLMRDTLVARFALKFLNDGSYRELSAALESGRTEEAFRAAHTLKGVCLNLAFTKLGSTAFQITELLRAGDLEAAKVFFPAVAVDYDLTVKALTRFRNEN